MFYSQDCDLQFCTDTELKNHLLNHGKQKLFKCPFCPVKVTTLSGYTRHKLAHEQSKLWRGIKPEKLPCSYCEKTYSNQQSLQLHLSKTHFNRDLKYACEGVRSQGSARDSD